MFFVKETGPKTQSPNDRDYKPQPVEVDTQVKYILQCLAAKGFLFKHVCTHTFTPNFIWRK